MRSLFITYPRIADTLVMASLFDIQDGEPGFNLPVLDANANGISVRLPKSLTGMFDLRIQDGKQSILKRIGLQ